MPVSMKMSKRKVLSGALSILAVPSISRQTNNVPSSSDQKLIVDIDNENKTQFLQRNNRGEYKHGYTIHVEDEQYHHENKGADNVTCGCYGYIDPRGNQVAVFYVSDQWGYRTVQPGRPVEIFLHPHEHGEQSDHGNGVDDSSSGGGYHHHGGHGNGRKQKEHEHHGQITKWENLNFPEACGTSRGPTEPPPVRPDEENEPSDGGESESENENGFEKPSNENQDGFENPTNNNEGDETNSNEVADNSESNSSNGNEISSSKPGCSNPPAIYFIPYPVFIATQPNGSPTGSSQTNYPYFPQIPYPCQQCNQNQNQNQNTQPPGIIYKSANNFKYPELVDKIGLDRRNVPQSHFKVSGGTVATKRPKH